ncbi:MAG: hypothetical protein NT046_06305 [Arenimonas sp.]|nr:hypothetical protein [Arenimonas sp.]
MMIPWTRQAIALALLTLAASVQAAPHATRDLRLSTDGDGALREISICARPSPDALKNLPGHLFVAYSILQQGGQRLYLAVGHTTSAAPKDALMTYFGTHTVRGSLSEELYTHSQEECLVLQVNEGDFGAAYQLTQPFLPPGSYSPDPRQWRPTLLAYSLGGNDCMEFAIGVARVFERKGLVVPQRGATELPLTYVRRLIDAN